MEAVTRAAALTAQSRRWRVLSLCLITMVSMATSQLPAQDLSLLDPGTAKQSLMEVQQDKTSPTTLLYTSYDSLGQFNDIHRTFSILPNTESPKPSEYYHSHTVDTVHGSASRTPTSSVQNPQEPLSGPALLPGVQHSQTSTNFPLAAPDAELPFPSPGLQAERSSNSTSAPGKQEELSNHLVSSNDFNIQNDATLYDHQLYPSHVMFGNFHVTSSFTEPTLGPPEVYYPTNTMDVDYGSGSGDYLETMSYMGSEGEDYSLVTNIPSDMYDFEDSNSESYDTSFPTRAMIPLSTRYLSPSPSSSFPSRHATMYSNTAFSIALNSTSTLQSEPNSGMTSANSLISNSPTYLSVSSTIYSSAQAIQPTAVHSSISLHHSDMVTETSELYSNWPDVTIEPSDVLLPDMNSLEYYNIQLTKNNESLTEQRGNQTTSKHFSLPISLSTTSTYTASASHMFTVMYGEDLQSMDTSWSEESSTDISGFDLSNTTVLDLSDIRPSLMNATIPFSYSSALTPSMDFSTSLWGLAATTDWISTESVFSSISSSTFPSVPFTPPDPVESDVMFTASTNTYWSINSTVPETSLPTSSLTKTHNVSEVPTESTLNSSSVLSRTEMADQGFTGAGSPFNSVTDDEMTTVSKPADSTPSVLNNAPTMTTLVPTTDVFNSTTLLTTPSATTQTSTLQTTTVRDYLCNLTKPDTYLVRVGFPLGSTSGYAKAKVREILKAEFNRSVELQVVKSPPDFVFRAVSGPVVYTAISVMNTLRRFAFTSDTILSVAPISPVPGQQYHIHSVLQFVPTYVDMHVCTFIEHIERGLIYAFAEVRRRFKESTDFSVHILNITMSPVAPAQRQLRGPVDITFVVRDARGYIQGSEVSSHLRHLSVVEFSYYLGYPVQQIAEPYHYPELNTTQLLRSSWVRTVLLGVMEHDVSDRTFQAKMERRLALLLGEGLSAGRRLKRATSAGNNSVQIVQITRLEEQDNPMEMIYFVEGANGERLPAVNTADFLNKLDVQHAAILLGYRIQGILAQPLEKQALPTETENTNTWIIVGVVVPVLVVMIIISILYWKLCRTDKLEFQPDTMSTVQQRQKLQTPSVKGFDFAKLHLGQHSKDDLRVIQEPLPAPAPAKEPNTNENTGVSTPKNSKGSSTKASCNSQHRRGQISPSDGDSVGSEPFSERESPKGNPRQAGPVSIDPKQPRPPPLNGADEQVSSASIFEHVDRMSRSADGANKRLSGKIQLIAMQPMPALPLPCPVTDTKAADNSKMNKEIQVALRQKSEIEHHRNKIRLRAKRKGHYDFPAMDDLIDSLGDAKEQDRIYQKAQMQIDKILDPDSRVSPLYTEPRKREKRSPKQRKKQQMNGDLTDADRDRLITNDSDGTYRKYPGVNNVAYVSDPDQGPEAQSPSPTDDVFLSSMSPPAGHIAPPPPYLPPQPSIEEARQQMHSLLDDAFALVSPTSQAANAGITLPGLGVRTEPTALSSPPSRGPRPCGPSYPALSPFSGRYSDLGLSPSAVQGLMHRQGLGGGYNQAEAVSGEQLQSEGLYNNRGGYMDEPPSSARPRPVGGTTGAQLHHMTQVGLSGRVNEARQPGALNWGPYHEEDFRPVNRDPVLDSFDYPLVSMFQNPRSGMREPSAPPAHLDTMGLGFSPSAPPEDSIPPSHSSASLIKAIREELMRLSQKQAAPAGYHS